MDLWLSDSKGQSEEDGGKEERDEDSDEEAMLMLCGVAWSDIANRMNMKRCKISCWHIFGDFVNGLYFWVWLRS